ncbi:MAG: ATP-binding cassette domain-containing protein [Anaerolineae bacterium]
MRGISKRFGSVQALNDVDLELRRGEILGLVGDNAAGKSTLMKCLSGAVIPDEGEIFVEGQRAMIRNPVDARARGIEIIYQDLALFNNLDVAANIFIGREQTRHLGGSSFLGELSFLDKRKMSDAAAELLGRLKINIASPKLPVAEMSGGQRQMVACARAIAFQSKILIMDEPTAALGVKEANTLLRLIKELKDNQGLSIILITQRIPDVLAIGDRVMVLKAGERQGMLEVDQCTLDDVVELIIKGRAGREEDVDYLSFG